ncbi:serine hydrolase [uncultured Caulobacter sp.]|uniref:serine hydrolase domain-containing protein n=1 Tax=uncultured Caulobacter sp. TaxID=158749 RepID=UPI00261F0BD4|nr:serine hydrolase [uncultured Caulobacter sp.]
MTPRSVRRRRALWLSSMMAGGAMILAGAASADPGAPPGPDAPMAKRLGFWSPSEQEAGYRAMETIFPTHPIKAGKTVRALPPGQPLSVNFTYDHRPYTEADFMKINRVSGLLVLKDGKVLLERYGLGRKPTDRWTSFSIAKSVTSTLLGAAIRDGAIKSLDDRADSYVTELKGGAYDGVTLRQLLTMTSGVHWNEDYNDPASDFNLHATELGPEAFKRFSALPRDAEPGKKFHYSTGESNLIGAVVMRATGKGLAEYLSEKVWRPYGMETDGVWMTSQDGLDLGGICFSARLRDYGRLGQFMLEGAQAGGNPVLPAGWIDTATRSLEKTDYGTDYGFQWWIEPFGGYAGIGIMGQALYIEPSRNVVIVIQSAWSNAGTLEQYRLQVAFMKATLAALDARTPH